MARPLRGTFDQHDCELMTLNKIRMICADQQPEEITLLGAGIIPFDPNCKSQNEEVTFLNGGSKRSGNQFIHAPEMHLNVCRTLSSVRGTPAVIL